MRTCARFVLSAVNYPVSALLFTLPILVLCGQPAFAQVRWQKNYGGVENDFGHSVQQTADSGYIVAGATTSFGNDVQVYLVKVDFLGDTLWTKTYGGPGDDRGESVQQTADGGYIIVGTTTSFGNGYQIYLIKTNPAGDTVWTKTFGGPGQEVSYSVRQTSDGGYIVAGTIDPIVSVAQVYLVKTDAVGDTLWTRCYGGAEEDYGLSVQQTQDGGYIIAGLSFSFGNAWEVYLVKTNASGDTLWTRTYGGTGDDYGRSVQQTQDGGYVVAGVYDNRGTNPEGYLIKTDVFGDTLWTRIFGGTGTEEVYTVQQTADRGYIVAGWTSSLGNGYQAELTKWDAMGDVLWTRTYGGLGNDHGYSVRQTRDLGYIVAGSTDSFGKGGQVYVVKTDANGMIGVGEERQKANVKNQRLSAVPNPFTSSATITGHEREIFSLYDASGRLVGICRGDRIGAGLAPGVYFVQAESGLTAPQRIVKVK